jgi:hypothetical protein
VPMAHCDQPPVGQHPCSVCGTGTARAGQPACTASPAPLYVFGACNGPKPANCIDGGVWSCGKTQSCGIPPVIGGACATGPQSICKP